MALDNVLDDGKPQSSAAHGAAASGIGAVEAFKNVRQLFGRNAASRVVDPVPSALVVTAIVIGLSVTAVMLAYAIRLYESKKTLSIDAFTESKW